MDKIIQLLKTIIDGKLVPVIEKIIGLLLKIVGLADRVYTDGRQDKLKKAESDADKAIKDACDSGSIQDLIDATNRKGKL